MSQEKAPMWEKLCEFVEIARQKHNVPSIVVGLVNQGDIKAVGYGVTNVEHPLDVTDDTLFQR